MTLKTYTPTTQSQRQLIQLSKKHLKKKPLLKKKIKGLKISNGRNNLGKITVHHKGGGHKRKYRIIDFYRLQNSTGIVNSIEYDPNRNANIASIYDFEKNSFNYIISPKNLKIGDIIKSGASAEVKLGHHLKLLEIPVGSLIHNIAPKTKKKGQIARSAGLYSKLKEKKFEYVRIELSSGEQRLVSTKSYATIGIVSNELFNQTKISKAGRSRWLNKRPSVRGVAMNPIDHPHGGGEGKKSGKGRTPWGKPVKSGRTSNSKNKLVLK